MRKYFKYKALEFKSEDVISDRCMNQVIDPIVESYFYLPSREKLNDPNEGLFQNQIQNALAGYLRGLTSIGEQVGIRESIYNLTRQISQSTDTSGVFSLSKIATDELMWAHYCGSHSGLLIEYDLQGLTRFCPEQYLNCFGVEYVEEPPNLDLNNLQGYMSEVVRTMLGHKSPRWSYEEEFRIVLENINGKVPHDYRAIESITFGLKIPKETREKIYFSTRDKVQEYYEICKVPESYSLERKIITEYKGELPKGKACNIDWSYHFNNLSDVEKSRIIPVLQSQVENDPHFMDLVLAEKSTTNLSKAVFTVQANHHMDLFPGAEYTRYYYDL